MGEKWMAEQGEAAVAGCERTEIAAGAETYELRGPLVATSMMGFGSWRIVRTKTWTIAPSNCALAQRSSSARASLELRPFLYVRSLVMVSYASATAMMRAPRGMPSPESASG